MSVVLLLSERGVSSVMGTSGDTPSSAVKCGVASTLRRDCVNGCQATELAGIEVLLQSRSVPSAACHLS